MALTTDARSSQDRDLGTADARSTDTTQTEENTTEITDTPDALDAVTCGVEAGPDCGRGSSRRIHATCRGREVVDKALKVRDGALRGGRRR